MITATRKGCSYSAPQKTVAPVLAQWRRVRPHLFDVYAFALALYLTKAFKAIFSCFSTVIRVAGSWLLVDRLQCDKDKLLVFSRVATQILSAIKARRPELEMERLRYRRRAARCSRGATSNDSAHDSYNSKGEDRAKNCGLNVITCQSPSINSAE